MYIYEKVHARRLHGTEINSCKVLYTLHASELLCLFLKFSIVLKDTYLFFEIPLSAFCLIHPSCF
jgi:hypothetical protein